MTIEELVLKVQLNEGTEDKIIREYIPFILSCANKTTGRYITQHDDEFSIAIFAFHLAIQQYSKDKGSFLGFSKIVIRNKLIDYIRKESNSNQAIPFSALQAPDADNNITEFEPEAPITSDVDAKYEIEQLTYELSELGISFFDVAKSTPKSKKTKISCTNAVRCILNDDELKGIIKTKHYVPLKQISSRSGTDRKLLERHKNYIAAVVFIMTGDYDIIQDYFPYIKGGERI